MPLTATVKRWRGPNGKILRGDSGKRYLCEDCPCEEGFPAGDDCARCSTGTTPQAYDIVFSGLTNANCASASYYNGRTFHFVQDPMNACNFLVDESGSNTLGGPCGLGAATLTVYATYYEIAISEVGGAVFYRLARTDGTSCAGPLTLAWDHEVGAPTKQLGWTAGSAVCTAVAA